MPVAPTGRLRVEVLALPGRTPVKEMILRALPATEENGLTDVVRLLGEFDVRLDMVNSAASASVAGVQSIRSRLESSRDGVFELNGLPSGEIRLELQAPGYTPYREQLRIAPYRGGDGGEPVEVPVRTVLLEPGGVFRGRVVDEQGAPIAGGWAWLGGYEALPQLDGVLRPDLRAATLGVGAALLGRSGVDGLFTVQGVNSSTLKLLVGAPGYAPREVELSLPEDLLRAEPRAIPLGRGKSLDVTVRDLEGEAVVGGYVTLSREDLVPIRSKLVGPTGAATFPGLYPGRYWVTIRGDRREFRFGDVPEEGDPEPVELQIGTR